MTESIDEARDSQVDDLHPRGQVFRDRPRGIDEDQIDAVSIPAQLGGEIEDDPLRSSDARHQRLCAREVARARSGR